MSVLHRIQLLLTATIALGAAVFVALVPPASAATTSAAPHAPMPLVVVAFVGFVLTVTAVLALWGQRAERKYVGPISGTSRVPAPRSSR